MPQWKVGYTTKQTEKQKQSVYSSNWKIHSLQRLESQLLFGEINLLYNTAQSQSYQQFHTLNSKHYLDK